MPRLSKDQIEKRNKEIIDMLNNKADYNTRDIARLAHCSLSTVSKISKEYYEKKYFPENDTEKKI